MAVTKYAKSGTAGALTVIAILIVAMAPLNLAPGVVTLDSLADDSVYINKSVVKQGEQFAVHFSPQILSEDVGIFYFVVDFHDNRGIYVIERETDGYIESSLLHAYNEVGQYTISVLALRGNISRIFAIPITVEPDLKEVEIQTSSDAALEDEPITFNAEIVTSTLDNMEDYVWDLGDGKTKIGKTITHSYDNPGEYSVRLRAYTNDSVVYTDFTTVRITNGIPNVSILSDRSSAIEDETIEFNADVSDANSDLDTLQYIWSFGDGNYRTGPSVSHTYETSGTFTIALTVFDNDGAMGTAQRSFVVSNDPVRNAEIETVTKGLYEGESVISTVEVTESQTDLYSLQYDWNVAGIGKQVTVPYLDNGQFRHNVTVTDDDGASTFAESDLINIVNVNPIVALIGGETSYNLTISMWGTNTTQLNFTLFNNFRNATQIGNSTITSVDEGPTGNLESYTFYNIRQKLYEYWDILFYVNNATNDYENFVRMEFSFPDANNITLTQLCTGTKTCSATTWRQPISPLDLNFPLDLEFEYFDPSEDDLTLTVNFGDTVVETDIPSVPGEISTGTIEVSGVMSGNQFSRGLSYYIEDDDGGRSSDSTIPLADYSKIPPPEGYPNITSWARAGKFIKHYAPGLLIDTFEEVHENSRTIFQVETYYYESEALNYTWSMGDGNRYDQESPIHSFAYSGEYLIWVKVSDGFYESARYMWIEVVNNFQQFEPFFTSDEIDYRLIPQITTEIIESCVTTGNETVYVTDCYDVQVSSQGLPMEGKEFQFTLSGIYFDLIGTSNYEYMWDFGDGSVGYGLTPSHAYATSGDYEITIHVIDEHGFVQYFLLPMSIANSAPIDDWPILSEYNLVEGQHLYIPHVYTDSPTDLESLDYEWYIDGEVYTDPSLSVNLSHGIYDGLMIVTDADGAATNHSFSVTVEKDPLELTVSKIELYGPTDVAITAFGSVSPTVYNKDSYQNDTQISFTLSGRENEIFDTGMATHIPGTYSFSLNLNFSRLLTNATLLELEQQTQTIAEYHNAPDIISGKYRLSLQISDGQDVEQLDSAVNVLADQDGDMITDEFEFLMTNTLDDFTFSIFSSDTDENGISDSVEFLINDDEDQDGLPGFYEREIGSDPTKKDTDGDGLEDGWGSNGLGELVYQSDPTKRDTDDDGIEDLIEVIGWEVEIWAQSGVSVYMVNSDPVLADTDNDGLGDLLEQTLHVDPRNADSDGDGLEDGYEYNNSLAVFWWDSDNDTLSDGREVNGVDLEYVDEQGDTVFVVAFPSALIADSDDDGLLDGIEVNYLRSSPTSADTDQDSIPDIHELGNRTNIIDADTDNDGLSDGIELRGFEIPYYTLTNGEYDADGTVLKEPTMTNGTVYVTTDPTQWDTDGDGLSDGEEVLPDDERGLSNPRSIDSDGDGIPDKNDPFRLVSDYAPPEIVSGIELKYTSGALEIVETIVEIYTASLSAAWDILKGFGSLVTKLVKGVWKWKEVCFILCEDIPWIKSWRSIKSMATREIGKFLKDSWNSLKSVFTTITNELRDATKSFSMRSFDFDIDTDFWGIPNGISFSGILKMTTNLVRSFTAGIMDPEVEVRLTIIDDDIIDRIDVYQDNVLKKRIDVNSWFHFF
ncbi:MAG: PKD domain-containing protein, partial [Candidatus Kariarchaeaceae archaeon]